MLGNMVRFQHFQPRNLNIQIHLLLNLGVACRQRLDLRVGQRRVVHVLTGAHRAFARHNLRNELLLGFQYLPHIGVERAFRHIAENLHFWIHIALTQNPAFLLFQIGGLPGRVQMMQGDQAVLYVGPRAEFCRRPQQDTHLSGAHAGKQFRFLRFRRRFVDKGDFLSGNAHLDEFVAHIVIDVEAAVALGRGQVAKDELCRPFFYAALPDGKGVPHAGVDLAAFVVRKHFLHQPLIQRAFPAVIGNTQHIVYGGIDRAAAHPVRAFREGRYIFPLDFAGLQGDIHKLRLRDRQR